MYNKVILVGNLTRDLQLTYSGSGTAIGKTGLATNRRWKSQTGEQKEEVMFIDVTFFGRTAEVVNQYLKKGSKVLVEGRLSLQQWTAQDGSKRSKHEIIAENMTMLDSKGDNPNQQSQQSGYGREQTPMSNQNSQFQQQQQPQVNQMPQQQQSNPSPYQNNSYYNQGNQNNQFQQQQQPQANQMQEQQQKMPEIDISEDIPF